MSEQTIYSTNCKDGSSNAQNYGNNNRLYVGMTSSNVHYKGLITFPKLPEGKIIKLSLILYRTDSNLAHTLKFGGAKTTAWSGTFAWSKNYPISQGKGNKSLDFTEFIDTIQAYTGTWYMRVEHGSGSNSYSTFEGSATSTNRPHFVCTMQDLHSYVYVNGEWKLATPYVYSGGWKEASPYKWDGSSWVLI